GDFHAGREPDAGHLAKCRVRLLGRHDLDLGANAAFLRATRHRGMARPAILLDPRLAHQLVNCRHSLLSQKSLIHISLPSNLSWSEIGNYYGMSTAQIGQERKSH